jgi:N-methylhydantoinase B
MNHHPGAIDVSSLGILWDKLIAIVDEIQLALVRTSFSTVVREASDLSCSIVDESGRGIAQGTFSLPSFIGCNPNTVKIGLQRFPLDCLEPGDILATNDPWIGSGHLNDITLWRPIFRHGKVIGFTVTTTHLSDIGGNQFSAVGKSVFEEGLRLPICKIYRKFEPNEDLFDVIRANVRVPREVIGDINAQISANIVGEKLVNEFLEEYGLDNLSELTDLIIERSEVGMKRKISEIPNGEYFNEINVEGIDEPFKITCLVTVENEHVTLDFDGTGGASKSGINVPFFYTYSFATYAIKCITIPDIPNNEGCLNPITVKAPKGCILNAQPPSPVGARNIIGHFVTSAVLGALSDVVTHNMIAEPGMLSSPGYSGKTLEGHDFSTIYFSCGGTGARSDQDGISTTGFPSNIASTPVEIFESTTHMQILKKHLMADSGGPGRYRGGLGQETLIKNTTSAPVELSMIANRTEFPASGYRGGRTGARREVFINGKKIHPKSRYTLEQGAIVTVRDAGGGGFYPPQERDVNKVMADVRDGLVSLQAAKEIYCVDINLDTMDVDRRGTEELRSELNK